MLLLVIVTIAIISVSSALISLFKIQNRKLAGYYFISAILVSLLQLALYSALPGHIHITFIPANQIILIVISLLVPICYKISFVLGNSTGKTKRNTIKLLSYWLLSLTFSGFILKGTVIQTVISGSVNQMAFSGTGHYFLLYLIIANILNLTFLENKMRVESQPLRIRIPLIFLMGSFIFTIIFASNSILTGNVNILLLVVLSAFICATYASHIFLSILSDIGSETVSVNRDFLYSSFMLMVIGAYLILIGFLGKLVSIIGGNVQIFFSVITAGVVLLIFFKLITSMSIKNKIKKFTDKSFFKEKYDYRAVWSTFSEDISIHLEKDPLCEAILNSIVHILQVEKAALFTLDQQNRTLYVAKQTALSGELFELSLKHEFCDWLWRLNRPVDLTKNHAPETTPFQNTKDRFLRLELIVCVPLSTKKGLLGIVALGQKITNKSYTDEDLKLLETFANHTAIALQNLNSQENLRDAKKMESLHKISSFILHDLKNISSSLFMLTRNAQKHLDEPDFQKSLLKTLTSSTNKMKTLLSKISFDNQNISVEFAETDVNGILQSVLKTVDFGADISVDLKLQSLPPVKTDAQQLQKIILNLVLNALEAMPNGGTLTLHSACCPGHSVQHDLNGLSEKDLIEIRVQDTGVGMDKEFISQKLFKPFSTTKPKGLGIGLFHCKELVHALQGELNVQSVKNTGTTFFVYLPVLKNNQQKLSPKDTFISTQQT